MKNKNLLSVFLLAFAWIAETHLVLGFSTIPRSIPTSTNHNHQAFSSLGKHALIQRIPTATSIKRTTVVMAAAPHPIDPGLIFNTWEWCANLGAPAALVAGAVLATLVEGRATMSPKKSDKPLIRTLKRTCRFLLLSSFGLEVISIFVTTVSGTMLLSIGDVFIGTPSGAAIEYKSPIGFLMHNWEFEFLTAHMCFLQGLFNWLASVALELLIPKRGEGKGARNMNLFISSSLFTIVLGMLSFLNSHLFFYNNYANMWRRYAVVAFQKYFCPATPMSFVLLPAMVTTVVLGYKAFTSLPEEDNGDDDS